MISPKKQKELKSILPGSSIGVHVIDGDIAFALRQFKKRIKQTRIMKEVYDRKTYTKPSILRKQQKQSAVHKQRMITKDAS